MVSSYGDQAYFPNSWFLLSFDIQVHLPTHNTLHTNGQTQMKHILKAHRVMVCLKHLAQTGKITHRCDVVQQPQIIIIKLQQTIDICVLLVFTVNMLRLSKLFSLQLNHYLKSQTHHSKTKPTNLWESLECTLQCKLFLIKDIYVNSVYHL